MSNVNEQIDAIKLPLEVLLCDNINCTDITHASQIDRLPQGIIDCLVESSNDIPKEVKDYNQVLGWNEVCKEVHSHAKEAFLLWSSNGKPRQGVIFELMEKTKDHFKSVFRQCKLENTRIKCDLLATKLLKKGL